MLLISFVGDSLANSFNSRYSRHSYDGNVGGGAGGTRRSKQSESSAQTVPETREDGVQADLDHTRTQGLSLDSSGDSADLNFPSHFGEDLESELLPIRVMNKNESKRIMDLIMFRKQKLQLRGRRKYQK